MDNNITHCNEQISPFEFLSDMDTESSFKIAIIQMKVTSNRDSNLKNAKNLIDMMYLNIEQNGGYPPLAIVLPEFFNFIGDMNDRSYVEEGDCSGPSLSMLSSLAKQYQVFIFGGSIIEKDSTTSPPIYYNTCFIFDREGKVLDRYRKIHLFDSINPPFKESSHVDAGNKPCIVTLQKGINIGVGICHDVRLEELSTYYSQNKCSVIVYPICFDTPSVSNYMDILFRSRAFDNYVYTVGVNSANGGDCWNPEGVGGRSICCDPSGAVISRMGATDEGYLIATIDLKKIKSMYSGCPVPCRKRMVF